MKRNKLFPGLPNYTGPTSGLFGLVHHDILFEGSSDIMERVEVVRRTKPAREIPTRLRSIIRIPKSVAPRSYRADAAYDKASAAYDKARAACDKARAACAKALAAEHKQVETWIRRNVPNCPWNGKKIVFP